jgi:DNA-binding Lrp family transcriptional regulator
LVNEQTWKHKRIILKYLDENGPLGTSELKELTELHRETVLILCNELVKEGWIYDKEHKHGKYRLKKKSDFYFPPSSLFRHKLFSNFNRLPLVTEEKNGLFNLDQDKLSTVKDHDYFEKYVIFEFSNRIGALITYLIIEAMQPKGLIPPNPNISINLKNSKSDFISGREREKIVREFITAVIDPHFLLQKFSLLRPVRVGLKINNPIKKNIDKIINSLKVEEKKAIKEKNYETKKETARKLKELRKLKEMEMNPQDPYWSMHELDMETYTKLKQIYSDLYPRFFTALEKIKTEVSMQK